MKIAYLGIDLLEPVLDALLGEGCRVLKLFTCPVDNVTETNTAVIKTARERGIPHTLERIARPIWSGWRAKAASCWCARGITTAPPSRTPSPW